jgi:hypothetical protein
MKKGYTFLVFGLILIACSVLVSAADTDNLVALWKMDNVVAGKSPDKWGGHNADVTGTLNISNGILLNDTSNWMTGANFAVADVSNGINTSFQFSPSASFSLAFWLNSTAYSDYDIGMGFGDPVNTNHFCSQIYTGVDGLLRFDMTQDGTGGITVTTNGAMTALRWYFVVLTYDNVTKNQTIYINGAKNATSIYNKAGLVSNYLFIGRRWDASYSSPHWFIDHITLYNTSVNQANITYLYNGGLGRDVLPNYVAPVLTWVQYPPNITLENGTETKTYQENVSCSGDCVSRAWAINPLPGLSLNQSGFLSAGIINKTGNYSMLMNVTDTPTLLQGNFWVSVVCSPVYGCGAYGVCNASDLLPCVSVLDSKCNLEYIGDNAVYDDSCECEPNFTCVEFGPCNIANIEPCLNVTDVWCGHDFLSRNYTAYNRACNLNATATTPGCFFCNVNAFVILVSIIFWVFAWIMAYTFRSFLWASMGFIVGIVLGLYFIQYSAWVSIILLLFGVLLFMAASRGHR